MTEWKEFSVTINNDAQEAVSAIFSDLGSSGVSIVDRNDFLHLPEYGFDTLWELDENKFPKEGAIIKGYFTQHDDLTYIENELRKRINKLPEYGIDLTHFHLDVLDVKEEEWSNAWKKYYHPVSVTRFLTIVPQWETYEKKDSDERILYLDPGLAFGTGTHPTTQLCIQALEISIRKEATVFDVGTGSGVLSIASALYGAGKINAYDLDNVAVTSARDNIRLNGLEDAITVEANNLLEGIKSKADIIVANILAEIILPFIPDAYAHLEEDGLFITSGIISDKKDQVIEELKKHQFDIVQVNQMNDWVAIIARKQNKENEG
ncbi:50S ribosomal protein L11 methyltransferase [Alkalibacterium iburiense]|uniref:Ribosomal protein L11 methyltransferase n=1 Tax=Alkalibacterium iburiense TaxID=290589 RepID=A0ABP3GUJ2_9LACT